VTELAEYLKIKTLIDRGYDYPQDLRTLTADGSSVSDISGDFRDWLGFVDYQCARHGMVNQKAQVGSRTQIVPLKHPVKDFGVRILFANAQVAAKQADTVASEYTPGDGQYNENCLSVGIKICYGDFDFYTGGDIAGIDWKDAALDIERYSKVTKQDVVDFAGKYLLDNNYAVTYKRQGIDTSQKKIEAPAITPIATNRDKRSAFLGMTHGADVGIAADHADGIGNTLTLGSGTGIGRRKTKYMPA
jgi:hypothetical protein